MCDDFSDEAGGDEKVMREKEICDDFSGEGGGDEIVMCGKEICDDFIVMRLVVVMRK